MFKRDHGYLKRRLGDAIRTMPSGILSGGKSEKRIVRRRRERARSDVLRDLVARQLAFPCSSPRATLAAAIGVLPSGRHGSLLRPYGR